MPTSKDLHHFIIGAVQERRNQPAGLQHADDPRLLLGVMQSALSQHPGVYITDEAARKIKDYFRQEAIEYHSRFNTYVQTEDYKPYWDDIDSMIDRMKMKPDRP